MLSHKLHEIVFLVVNGQVRITERLLHLRNLFFQSYDFILSAVHFLDVQAHLLARLLPFDTFHLILTYLVTIEVELLFERASCYYWVHDRCSDLNLTNLNLCKTFN